MIRDLSNSLEKLLEAVDFSIETGQNNITLEPDIVFSRPTEPFTYTSPTIDLFLYDVRENVQLRNNEPIIERVNGQVVIHRPPIRINCSYLVTVWIGDTETDTLNEHSLLSQVLQAFLRFPTIPPKYLQGSLQNQEPPLPMITAQADGLQNPAEFWTAIGNKLRPSLVVTVTISMPVFEDVTGPMVTTKTIGYDVGTGTVEESFVQIGGRVMDSNKNAIPDAIVDMQDVKLRSKTNEKGQYIFSKVPIGEHTVRVVSVGFQPKTKTIVVIGQSEEYEITLDSL